MIDLRTVLIITNVSVDSTATSTEYNTTLNVDNSDLTVSTTSSGTEILTTLTVNNDDLSLVEYSDSETVRNAILYFSPFIYWDFEPEVLWTLLARNSNEQINVSHLSDALGSLGDLGNFTSDKFIRKDIADTANEIITFIKGLKIGRTYTKGVTGGFLGIDNNGLVYAEVDKLLVRVKAYFEQLEIKETTFISGREIVSPGGGLKCSKVEELDDGYKCYFCADDGDSAVTNYFQVNDLAIGKTFNVRAGVYTNVSNHYFWRKVIESGEDYIILSKTDCAANSDSPEVGDKICQLGNSSDIDRQSAIIISTVDLNPPSITLLDSINSYSLVDKEVILFGYNSTTHEAYMNVYGSYYVGAKDQSSYIKYTKTGGVEILGNFTSVSTGKTLDDALNNLEDVKEQADRCWILWIESEIPTLLNEPASDWVTDADKDLHVDDIVMIKDTLVSNLNGRAWKFTKTVVESTVTYSWEEITDQYLLDALMLANSKKRVFTSLPTIDDEYDLGDLWTNATWMNTDGTYLYDDDILKCIHAKSKGTAFSIDDWGPASKYVTSLIKSEDERVLLAATNAATDAAGLANTANALANSAYNQATSAYNKAVSAYNAASGALSDADYNYQLISALRVDVNSVTAIASKLTFDSSGNVVNIDTSSLVLTSSFATMFTTLVNDQGIASTSSIMTYVNDQISGINATVSKLSFDSSGNVVNISKAGLVVSTGNDENSFTSLFATRIGPEGLAKTAEIKAYVDGEISHISIVADNVTIGSANLGEIISVTDWGTSSATVIFNSGVNLFNCDQMFFRFNSGGRTDISTLGVNVDTDSVLYGRSTLGPGKLVLEYTNSNIVISTFSIEVDYTMNTIIKGNFPKSRQGLLVGTIWNDGGTLKVAS